MLTYRGFRMLLTGDAGFQTESRLLRDGADIVRMSSKWFITDLPMRPAAISWTPCNRATR